MIKKSGLFIAIVTLWFGTLALFGNECANCHKAKNVLEATPSIPPIRMMVNGQKSALTLADAYKYHSHSCPGLAATFRAIQYGIRLLYADEIPSRDDLFIISRSPQQGGLDFLDFMMKDQKVKERTAVPDGMKSSRDSILFTIIRKSTSTAVDIQLKPEHYPEDFFKLKMDKQMVMNESEGGIKLHSYMKNMILTFPTMSFEELFGRPKPYKIIGWGELLPEKMGKAKREMDKSPKD